MASSTLLVEMRSWPWARGTSSLFEVSASCFPTTRFGRGFDAVRSIGHTCVWHSQLAPWVEAGNFSAAELTKIIEDHCGTIVGHYRGDM